MKVAIQPSIDGWKLTRLLLRCIGNGRWLSIFWDAYRTVYTLAKTVGNLSFLISHIWQQWVRAGEIVQRN